MAGTGVIITPVLYLKRISFVKLAVVITALLALFTAEASFAASATIGVSATVLSNSNCRFTTAPGALNFGNLDPSKPNIPANDVIATSNGVVRCGGSAPVATFSITQDYGIRGNNTMANGAYTLPYTFTVTPPSATGAKPFVQAITVSGTVKVSDYRNAYAGYYTDTVIISVNP